MHCSCWHGGGTTAAIGGAEAAHNGAQQAGMELQAGRKGLAWCAWGLRGTAASLGLPQRPTPHHATSRQHDKRKHGQTR